MHGIKQSISDEVVENRIKFARVDRKRENRSSLKIVREKNSSVLHGA